MGDFWITTLSAIRRNEPDWGAIEAYETPIRRFLAARYPALQAADREDLLQDVLLAMRERVVAAFRPDRGSFRALLGTTIANRVTDFFRRRRARAGALLEEPPAAAPVAEDDVAAVDLEAEIVRAVREVHDRRSKSGPDRDLPLVYALTGALALGLGEREIAAREGLSPDQVKRLLQRARGEILHEIFGRLLDPGAAGRAVERAADLARACLREPRKEARLLEAEPDRGVRAAVADFTARLRCARTDVFAGEDDFVRGVRAIFEVAE